MSGKLSSLSRRLTRIERQLIGATMRAGLANCNCQEEYLAGPDKPGEFEAAMNLKCPAHGFRRLGAILVYDSWRKKTDTKLNELLEIYEARLAARKLRLSKIRQAGHEAQGWL